ncbi:MAG: hypothetical protein H6556_26315 [Lewinellaceae bacterium]|nr:hypothetical protein [Lewinellaceae bacterium]
MLIGQNTFSYRFDFGFPAVVLTSIVATDSCFYSTGIIADSIPPFNTGNIFVKFSLDGQVLIAKTLKDTLKTYETWRGNLAIVGPDRLAVSGNAKDGIRKDLLLVFNTQGDTLFSAGYPHPNYPEVTGTINRDFKKTEDGFVILNYIKNPDGTGDTDIELSKLDTAGRFVWSQTFGITSRDDTPHNVIVAPDGYIIAAIRDNTNIVRQDYEARNHIFKIDEQGEVLWEYFSPVGELRGKEGRAIATSDGGLLVFTGQGVEVYVNPVTGQLRWHNYVFKLDSSRQEEWGVLVRDSLPAIPSVNQFSSAVELDGGEGYVVAGNLAEYHPDDSWHVGVLAKISPDGDLLWKRYYQHIAGEGPRHYINDLAQAPDGGFIMAGEVRDTVNAPRQQGWLLKVDEYGCLVPGCELVSSVEEPKSSDDSHAFAEGFGSRRKSSDDCTLLLYPNPVSEALQVYFTAPAGGEHHFRILDAQGREWRRFSTRLSEVTLLVEVGELPGGVYYLQCLRDGQVVGVEGFVKR